MSIKGAMLLAQQSPVPTDSAARGGVCWVLSTSSGFSTKLSIRPDTPMSTSVNPIVMELYLSSIGIMLWNLSCNEALKLYTCASSKCPIALYCCIVPSKIILMAMEALELVPSKATWANQVLAGLYSVQSPTKPPKERHALSFFQLSEGSKPAHSNSAKDPDFPLCTLTKGIAEQVEEIQDLRRPYSKMIRPWQWMQTTSS